MITINATAAAHGLLRKYPNFINEPIETFEAIGVKVKQASKPLEALAKHYGRDNLHGVIVVDRGGRGEYGQPEVTLYLDAHLFPKTRRRSLCILMALYLRYIQSQSKKDIILFENYSSKQPAFKDRAYVDEFLRALIR